MSPITLRKGSFVNVVDQKDGKLYRCKVARTNGNRVLVHFVGWNKSHDEWLTMNDPRLRVPSKSEVNRASSLEPLPITNRGDRTSAEVEIDSLHDRLCSSQPDPRAEPLLNKTSPRNVNKKRGRDPNSLPRDEAPPKRTIFHLQGRPILRDEATSPSPSAGSAVAGGSEPELPPPAPPAPSQSSSPQVPQDATAITADPGMGDGGAVSGVSGNIITCGLCQLAVSHMKVGCHSCGRSFHADPLCLGVSKGSVLALVADVDGALTYKCCTCRFSGSVDKVGLVQLCNMLGEAVKAVRIDKAASSKPPALAPSGQGQVHREEILAQCRELKEREKRKDSVVIRGLPNITQEALINKVRTICLLLNIEPVVLSDVTKIGSTNMFRARIADSSSRMALLTKCHQLRPTEEFGNVYINKDLTYQQRQDLRSRRQGVQAGAQARLATGSNSVPVGTRTVVNPPNEVQNVQALRGHPTEPSRTTTPGGRGRGQTFVFPPVSNRDSHSVAAGGRGGRGSRVYSRARGRPRLSRGVSLGRGTAGDSNFLASTNLEQSPGPGVGRGEGSRGGRNQTGARGTDHGSFAATVRSSSRSGHPVPNGLTSQDDLSYPSTSDGRTHGGQFRNQLSYGGSAHQFSDVHIGDIPHLRHNLNF